MARTPARRPLIAPALDQQTGLIHALRYTLPGRLIVVGVGIRLVILIIGAITAPLPMFLAVADTVAALAIAVGAVYFVVRLFIAAKRRLLWRVRRKLILSYIFVGFIPAILIVAFFLLGGFLLFNNLSSYLVQSRLRALSEEAKLVAQSTALEIQRAGGRDVAGISARRQTNAQTQFPGVSLAVVPHDRSCAETEGAAGASPRGSGDGSDTRIVTAGPWAHVQAPRYVPAWITCAGFGGVL